MQQMNNISTSTPYRLGEDECIRLLTRDYHTHSYTLFFRTLEKKKLEKNKKHCKWKKN